MPLAQKIGLHVSIAGGVGNSVANATRIGCTAFQIFTRNPRGWQAKDLDIDEANKFIAGLSRSNIDAESVIVHMPYLPNLSAPSGELYSKSLKTLELEIARCMQLQISKLVIHLGSHLGTGPDKGKEQLIHSLQESVDTITSRTRKGNFPMILLENSAGQKNSIGSTFEDLRSLLDKLNDRAKFGICFDSCHAFASGYDLRTPAKVLSVMERFDSIVGLEEIQAAHFNDSKGELDSKLDRHEHIGQGKIGIEGLRSFLNHDRIRKIPIILETPNDREGDDLRNLCAAKDLIVD